jgi:hypothetical protein
MHALSTRFPEGAFRLLAAIPTDEGVGSATLFATGVDLSAVVAAMRAADAVTAVQPLDTAERAGVIQFETTEPFLQEPVRAAGIPFEPPLRIEDGVAVLTVTTTDEALSALGDELRDRGYGFEVEAVYDAVESGGPLTERQAEVLTAAVEEGYYESPRGVELNELADQLGVRKSTLSVTLRRAEGRLAERFVENRDTLSRLADPE